MAFEVRGRGAAQDTRRADAARHEVLAADGADANGEVEAFVDEIDDPLGELDVEAHLG
jgi:hypothetical protein